MQNQIATCIKQKLQHHQNKQNAQAMAAYMKTTMPFYGVRAAERRTIAKQVLELYPITNQQEYLDIIEHVWNQPSREEKYIAIDIARAYSPYINVGSLPLFKKMIQQGAWWDFVDDIAVHLVGFVLLKNLSEVWPIINEWISDSNMWIRRTALICQNKFKGKTDQKNLFAFCVQRAHEKEFFIQKAIGWALREYAKTNPKTVYDFINKHKNHLSNLSYREAAKNIDNNSI